MGSRTQNTTQDNTSLEPPSIATFLTTGLFKFDPTQSASPCFPLSSLPLLLLFINHFLGDLSKQRIFMSPFLSGGKDDETAHEPHPHFCLSRRRPRGTPASPSSRRCASVTQAFGGLLSTSLRAKHAPALQKNQESRRKLGILL